MLEVTFVQLSRRDAMVGLGGCALAAFAAGTYAVNRVGRSESPSLVQGSWTSFGSVAVRGWSRRAHADGAAVSGHSHHDAPGPVGPLDGQHDVWGQNVVVAVEVHNDLERPLLFSPGQFRLRVGRVGPSVMPYDAQGSAESVPAGGTLTTWVSFLAPQDGDDLAVEFTEAGSVRSLSMVLRSSMVRELAGSPGGLS